MYRQLAYSSNHGKQPLTSHKMIATNGWDTDFSQTKHLDRWDADGVGFQFGYDATANLKGIAEDLPKSSWENCRQFLDVEPSA